MTDTIRLVQIVHPQHGRRVAFVEEPRLLLLQYVHSIYALAQKAIEKSIPLKQYIGSCLTEEALDYDEVYEQRAAWHLLPAFDHPENPFACLVSGTGLTHQSSALNRQTMHQAEQSNLTDSMRMYQWGVQGGRPVAHEIGVQPEWFYKGQGDILCAHGQPLETPPYAEDGGEEPEVACIYVVDAQGQPRRIGFCTANEFSDHQMEQKNYLYLAPSKLRNCAIGPELVVDHDFQEIAGNVHILRKGKTVWNKEIHTGEKHMAHSLANLEYHHFKYAGHRIPFQAHIHFLGADAFSFGEKIQLQNSDVMEVQWEGMGRALQNTLTISPDQETLIHVQSI